MMHRKALSFNDKATAKRFLGTREVSEIKALGRMVADYDHRGGGIRQVAVCQGLLEKFGQNDTLRERLHDVGYRQNKEILTE